MVVPVIHGHLTITRYKGACNFVIELTKHCPGTPYWTEDAAVRGAEEVAKRAGIKIIKRTMNTGRTPAERDDPHDY